MNGPQMIAASGGSVAAYGAVGGRCLLIHGAGEDASIFAAQIRDVEGLWAIDLPGHGASPGPGRSDVADYARLVLDVLASHAPDGAWLGGHSMGGAVALAAALMAPAQLRGLVLISTGARLRVHPDLLTALGSGPMPPAFVDMMFAPGAPDGVRSALPQADASVQRGDFLACDRFDVIPRLSEIHLPALVLVGDQDRMTPEKYGRALAGGLEARIEVVPGAGHMLPLEAPEDLARSIAAFLEGGGR